MIESIKFVKFSNLEYLKVIVALDIPSHDCLLNHFLVVLHTLNSTCALFFLINMIVTSASLGFAMLSNLIFGLFLFASFFHLVGLSACCYDGSCVCCSLEDVHYDCY